MPASSTLSTANPPRTSCRWFQFRLRTLLIGVALLSVGLSGYAWLRQRAQRQATAVAALRELGVSVGYESDETDPDGNSFFSWRVWEPDSDLLSRDYFEHVVGVNASEYEKYGVGKLPLSNPHKFWSALQQLPRLKALLVANDQVRPEDLRILQSHSDLESLYIATNLASDEHLRVIGHLKGLRGLAVEGDWPSGRQAKVSHVGIDYLASLTHLRILDLSGTTVDDRAAQSLARLNKLERLYLIHTNLSDHGLALLSNLEHLEEINVSGSGVTKAGSDDFQLAMPNCEVKNFVPKK